MDDYEEPLSEVQDLVWALLDEHISDDQFHRLEQILSENEGARRTYVDSIQMHVDLQYLFGRRPAIVGFDPNTASPLPLADSPLPPGGMSFPEHV